MKPSSAPLSLICCAKGSSLLPTSFSRQLNYNSSVLRFYLVKDRQLAQQQLVLSM